MDSTLLSLRVAPKSAQDAIVGWHGVALKIKVRAVPENGRANVAVVELLAKALGVPRSAVVIEAGHAARDKRVRVQGLVELEARRRIDAIITT